MRHRVLRGQKPSIPLGCRRLVCCHPPRASGRARRTGSKLGSQQSAHAIQGLPGRFENLRLNTAGPIPSVPVRAAHTHTCRLRPVQGAGQVAGDASLDADEQTCDCLRCRGRGPKARLRALKTEQGPPLVAVRTARRRRRAATRSVAGSLAEAAAHCSRQMLSGSTLLHTRCCEGSGVCGLYSNFAVPN